MNEDFKVGELVELKNEGVRPVVEVVEVIKDELVLFKKIDGTRDCLSLEHFAKIQWKYLEYAKLHFKSGIKVGDQVGIICDKDPKTTGWANSWIPKMDSQSGSVRRVSADHGLQGFQLETGWSWPATALKLLTPEEKPKAEKEYTVQHASVEPLSYNAIFAGKVLGGGSKIEASWSPEKAGPGIWTPVQVLPETLVFIHESKGARNYKLNESSRGYYFSSGTNWNLSPEAVKAIYTEGIFYTWESFDSKYPNQLKKLS